MTQVTGPSCNRATAGGGIADDPSRLSSRENLEAAGRKFEAIFTGMMLKSMRQAKLGDGLFDSKAQDTFREMQDQKLAQSMAEHTPLGIGKAMVDFLAKSQTALQSDSADKAHTESTTDPALVRSALAAPAGPAS